MRRHALLLAAPLLLTACAEYAVIKSYPAGAKAIVDGQVIGTTPAWAKFSRGQVDDSHTWRVEYRDCDVAEGKLQTGIAPGRIVGYVFTLGIVALFKGPYYFHPVDAVLRGGDCATKPSRGTTAGASQPQLSQRLETLRDLYQRNVISKETFESESQKAINEYNSSTAPPR